MAAKLTEKQEKFCQKYIELGSASEAYREAYNAAGMKPATIHVKASQMLDQDKVRIRVEELQAESKKRFEVTVDTKKAWLVQIVEQSIRAVEVLDSQGEGIGEYRFDGGTAVRAINELNKMDGDHAPTKQEHTGKDGKPIETVTKVGRINFFGVSSKEKA